MKAPILTFLGEIVLWIAANVLCVVLPATVVFHLGHDVMNWGTARTSFFVMATVWATLTWGSWAALIWTRTRTLRVAMRGSTILPGVLTIGAGFFGAYVGVGALILWMGIMASGVAMIFVALGLSRAIGANASPRRRVGMLLGGIAFPVLTTAFGLLAGSVWYQFISNPFDGDWRSLISFVTVIMSVMAMSLISTVIPAVMSGALQRSSKVICRDC